VSIFGGGRTKVRVVTGANSTMLFTLPVHDFLLSSRASFMYAE